MNDPLAKKYLRPKEVAAYFNVSHRTLMRLVDRGEIPRPVKVGQARRWWGPGLAEFDRKLREAAQ